MTSPTPNGVHVVTNALRSDAKEWLQQSDRMGTLVNMVRDLDFSRIEAGVYQLVVKTHRAVIEKVTDRCREGQAEMDSMRAALTRAAELYENQDAENALQMMHLS